MESELGLTRAMTDPPVVVVMYLPEESLKRGYLMRQEIVINWLMYESRSVSSENMFGRLIGAILISVRKER